MPLVQQFEPRRLGNDPVARAALERHFFGDTFSLPMAANLSPQQTIKNGHDARKRSVGEGRRSQTLSQRRRSRVAPEPEATDSQGSKELLSIESVAFASRTCGALLAWAMRQLEVRISEYLFLNICHSIYLPNFQL